MALLGNLTGSSPLYFNKDPDFYNGVATTSFRNIPGATLTLAQGTPTSATTFCMGGWFKRQNNAFYSNIFSAELGGSGVAAGIFAVSDDDTILFYDKQSSDTFRLITDREFRDTSAWYHVWMRVELGNSTSGDRVQLWVNGVRETSFSTETYPTASVCKAWNVSGKTLYMGHSNASYGGNVYMSDWYFIDGASVSPVDTVGEFKNGVFIPKAYSPTFGDNGFHLKFDQVGVGTPSTSTIGADTSGNTNHWTSTANTNVLAKDCAMPDSPENNFATFNPNFRAVTANTLSEGNLFCATSSGGRSFSATTIPIKLGTGKWFWEFRVSADGGGMGVAKTNGVGGAGAYQSVTATGTGANTTDYYYGETNFVVYADQIIHNGGNAVALDGTPTYPEVYGILFDSDASPPNMAVYRGGTAVGNIDCDNGFDYLPMAGDGSGAVTLNVIFNAGQDSTFAGNETAGTNQDANGIGNFSMAVPTDAKALCTANLPEPTIGANSLTQASDHFNSVLYTGASSGQGITGVGFQPDWTWIKSRSHASSHVLTDSSRGVTESLFSDTAAAESTLSGGVTAFGTDGFTLGTEGTVNTDTRTYVAWNWKANGGTATATITESGNNPAASVQANPTAGFSIITYTGTGAAGTIAHGLGAVPKMIICKNRNNGDDNAYWAVYHGENTTAPATDYLVLNTTAATADGDGFWNDTAPTSSVFTVNSNNTLNRDGYLHVAYVFAEVEGYSKFGSYTGNGNADGTFVYTGFRPAFIMFKTTTIVSHWTIVDNARSTYNVVDDSLYTDTSAAELTTITDVDFLSNGFKWRGVLANETNVSGQVYIYMAFAEVPFKYANAR